MEHSQSSTHGKQSGREREREGERERGRDTHTHLPGKGTDINL